MKKITAYFKGVGEEARRVRWPNKRKLWTSVGIVLFITVLSALVIYFEDYITVMILKAFETNNPTSSGSSSGTGGSNSIVPEAATMLKYFIGGLFR